MSRRDVAPGGAPLRGNSAALTAEDASDAATYTLEHLQPIVAGGGGAAFGINTTGDVVGWSVAPGGVAHPTLWRGNAVIDLGLPPGIAPFVSALATDINDTGTIAGYTSWAGGATSLSS